jgi:predicted NBD/HSP70 family sugar kinase
MVAAADSMGNILQQTRKPAPVSLEEGLSALNQMVARVTEGEPVLAMGAAIGGPLDWQKGVVSPLHQPTWRNVPLKQIMEDRWGCPFYVDVDTNIAALGEYHAGGVSARRFMYITISTGLGGGFLMDGKVYRGAGGAHPEIGHQSIPCRCSHPESIHCECGVPDCLEALVSGNGIRRIYGKPAETLDEAEWAEVAYNLGQGLRNIATFYAPELIRIGGGIAVGSNEKLIPPARQVMEEHLQLVPAPVVELSHLGYDTALLGAIAVAIHGLKE